MMLMPRKNDFDIFGGFFDDPFFNEPRHKEIMKTDIKEGENEYTLEIEMPGIKKENVKIELSKGYITISAENNNEVEEKEKNYIRNRRILRRFVKKRKSEEMILVHVEVGKNTKNVAVDNDKV